MEDEPVRLRVDDRTQQEMALALSASSCTSRQPGPLGLLGWLPSGRLKRGRHVSACSTASWSISTSPNRGFSACSRIFAAKPPAESAKKKKKKASKLSALTPQTLKQESQRGCGILSDQRVSMSLANCGRHTLARTRRLRSPEPRRRSCMTRKPVTKSRRLHATICAAAQASEWRHGRGGRNAGLAPCGPGGGDAARPRWARVFGPAKYALISGSRQRRDTRRIRASRSVAGLVVSSVPGSGSCQFPEDPAPARPRLSDPTGSRMTAANHGTGAGSGED